MPLVIILNYRQLTEEVLPDTAGGIGHIGKAKKKACICRPLYITNRVDQYVIAGNSALACTSSFS